MIRTEVLTIEHPSLLRTAKIRSLILGARKATQSAIPFLYPALTQDFFCVSHAPRTHLLAKASSIPTVKLSMRNRYNWSISAYELLMIDEDIRHIRHAVVTITRRPDVALPLPYWKNRLVMLLSRPLLPHQLVAVTDLLSRIDADLAAV